MRAARFATIAFAVSGCQWTAPPADVGLVAQWTSTHYALARAERLSPPVAARVSAYAAIALYEGWAAFSDSLRSLGGQLNGLEPLPTPAREERYDPATVAIEAQATVLLDLYQQGFASTTVTIQALHDSLVGVRRAAVGSSQVMARSVSFGTELGRAILAWAAKDGFLETRGKPYRWRVFGGSPDPSAPSFVMYVPIQGAWPAWPTADGSAPTRWCRPTSAASEPRGISINHAS